MQLRPFETFIYTEPEGPYTSWLETTTEKRDFEDWLTANLPMFAFSRKTKRVVRVLDLGCSWGSTSFRIMRVLHKAGLTLDYTAVDPYQPQLDKFRRLADASDLTGVTLHLACGNAEDWMPDAEVKLPAYDLVIGSHMLYYTGSEFRLTLGKMLMLGQELLVVHHGKRGINTVHEAFREYVHPGKNIVSTDDDVAYAMQQLPLIGRRWGHYRFPSAVDVSSIADPDSLRGRNLISFFLERAIDTIDPEVVRRVRDFIIATYAPDFRMTHDVGIITVTGS